MNDVDLALSALSDPTRRQVVERLAEGPRRTNELAEDVGVSVPAISRHLRVLRERGLVERTDVHGDGRGRRYQLQPKGLSVVTTWLQSDRWATQLPASTRDSEASDFLARVGGFLDGFARSDTSFFERHLADDAELIFPGSAVRWDKPSTVASVAEHSPFVTWDIVDADVRPLGRDLTIVVVTVGVRTAAAAEATTVIQSMVFDDAREPWTLRFLQQTSAD